MQPRIIIQNYDALLAMDSYLRRRFGIVTRQRTNESANRLESLAGLVTLADDRECLMEWENVFRLIPRVAVLSEPWLQNADDVLRATVDAYESIVKRMTYLNFVESSKEFAKYYHMVNNKGKTVNKSFYSRKFMVHVDHPLFIIATEMQEPKLQGAMLFFHTPMSEDAVQMEEDVKTELIDSTKQHLLHEFSIGDATFLYEQMFDGNGKLSNYGKKNVNVDLKK
jgi:hypothetical protein